MRLSTRLHLPREATELSRRMPWLLVFRVAVATALLALVVLADWRQLHIAAMASLLYGVIFANYFAVVGIGVLLRVRTPAVAVAAMYLAFTVATAYLVTRATGATDSAFTFLYLLAVLDAAIMGGRRLALVVALVCSLAFGVQALFSLDGGMTAPDWELAAALVANISAFNLTAFLAGHLAELLRRAHLVASEATADLEHVQALHATVLEALPVGVLAIDDQQQVHAANPRAREILGWPSPFVRGPLPAALCAVLPEPGGASHAEICIDGHERSVGILRSAPVAVREKTRVRSKTSVAAMRLQIVVIEDRTELAKLADRLVVQERLASLGRLAAAIAHEIRNPLAAISGSLELLLSSEGDAATNAPLKDIVLREVERLDRLLDEFLQFARPAPMELSRVDVAALTRELCAVMQTDPALAGRRIQLNAPERLEVEVDASRFRQVLWNLVRNAVEASPADAPIDVTLAGRRGGLELEVRDYGCGISAQSRMHLFEPFHTTKATGTGLGLAVVHRVVEGHGGSIELLDVPGGGTVARVCLPS